MLHESGAQEKFITTPRYENCGLLHQASAQVVWNYFDDSPKLDRLSHRQMEGFIPWIGYVGDAADLARLKDSLKRLLAKGFPRDGLRHGEIDMFRLYGEAFGGFCARNVMGAKEFAEEVRKPCYWDKVDLLWTDDRDDEQERREERAQIATFLLGMHAYGNMHKEAQQIYREFRPLISMTPEWEVVYTKFYFGANPDTLHGRLQLGEYLKNPPKVTPELIRQLEADFDNHYPDDLKRYLEQQFEKIEAQKN